MSSYLGKLGQLVKLKCPSNQSDDRSDRYSFSRTLEGRVKAQAKLVTRRSWSVDISTVTPPDMGALMAFTYGEWGNGPFLWVAEGAAVTNLLMPDVASCGPSAVMFAAVSVVGPLAVGSDWAGRSLANSVPGSNLQFGPSNIPVIAGQVVTGSAWVVGAGAKVRVGWWNSAGAFISAVTSTGSGVAGTATRLAVTGTPPAGAVSCSLYATATTQAARPAVTWTPQVMEWSDGQGCDKAVITAPSRQLVWAIDDPKYGRYANASFTVQEVG